MVVDELTDGKRIGQLLASEIHGHGHGALGCLAIVDADRKVEPTTEGEFAYGIELEDQAGEKTRLAAVYVHPDRIRLEVKSEVETALAAAKRAELRVRLKETEPPQMLVFVENGAEVKGALGVLRAVVEKRSDAIG